MSNTVVMIGWDGATWSVLSAMVELGRMPNLEELLKTCASGPLESTVPPVTAPAWTSMVTGVNPGKHGLFTWYRPPGPASITKRWVSSRDVGAPRLWDWHPGMRVGVIGLPVSYPPMAVNGFVVSGMLTPRSAESYTHPPELQAVVEEVADGYVLDVDIINDDWDLASEGGTLAFLEALRSACRKRAKVTVALAERYRPDLCVVVFETPDRIQHLLWPYAVANHRFAGWRSSVQEAVFDCYGELDAALGMLLDKLGAGTVMLVSDHGFCGQHSLVYTNGWLAEAGMLHYRGGGMRVRQGLRPLVRALRAWIPGQVSRRGRQILGADNLIDWRRTRAYTGFAMDHGIYVNLKGREPRGTVQPGDEYTKARDELRGAMLRLCDNRTGRPVFESVSLREELYRGPYVDQAPDLVYEMTPGYKAVKTPSAEFLIEDVSTLGHGFHDREGVLLVAGCGPKTEARVVGAKIIDVAPTILHLLGVAVPEYMDGRVLFSALSHSCPTDRPPESVQCSASLDESGESDLHGEAERSLIEKRLRRLGYL